MQDHLSFFAAGGDPADIEGLMAFHKARFAGWRMDGSESSDENTEGTEGESAEGTEAEGEQSSEENNEGNEEGSEESESENENKLSHDDALDALTKTRAEAASWRTKYREAVAKLEAAKTPEEFEAAKAEMTTEFATTERSLVVENVALRHKLDGTPMAKSLIALAENGATREQLEEHAKELAAFLPQVQEEEPEGSGGLHPDGDSGGSFDPVAAARAARARRSRRF